MSDGIDEPAAGAAQTAPGSEEVSVAAKHWDVRAVQMREGRDHWEGHPLVQAAMAGYRDGADLLGFLVNQLPPAPQRGVSLGVGTAASELALLERGAIGKLDLYDAAGALIASGRETAAEAGLSGRALFHVGDLNELELEPGAFDVVIWLSALHHVSALEHALEQCYRALRPGGLFFAHEYVGPNRFAFPAEHVDLARTIYRTLDPSLCSSWPALPVPDPVEVASVDPTESVRSEEIIDAVRHRFPSARVISYEACLTIIMWYGLNHDALYESERGFDLVRWLLDVDANLVRSGRLWSYQALLLANK